MFSTLDEYREADPPLEIDTELGEAVILPEGIVEAYKQAEIDYIDWMIADEAIAEFYKTTVDDEYMPSLVNLGNIYYLKDDLRMAKPFYERAYAVAPFDPRVLLAVAKVNHKLENYGNARDAYEKLINI